MNLELAEFVVMPNRFHGILIIGENKFNCRDAMHRASTSPIPPTNSTKFGPQLKNQGSIMRGFKSPVTIHSKILNVEFGWQERYHDHIIGPNSEFVRISNYILNNPNNWKDDKFCN